MKEQRFIAIGRPATAPAKLDNELMILQDGARRLGRLSTVDKVRLLRQIICRTERLAEDWVRAACVAKHIPFDAPVAGEEWFSGPMTTVRNVRLLARSLWDIAAHGRSLACGRPSVNDDGQVSVRVFPTDGLDGVMFRGFTADVILAGSGMPKFLPTRPLSSVGLVLGAGNVSSISALDVIYKTFVENQACVLKMNPVNDWLGPLLEQIFEPLVDLGLVRIVYGGADVGAYLCQHPLVQSVHVTGSQETHDTIVWGPAGPIRDANRRQGTTILGKPITAELGNVSPIIIVPDAYSPRELSAAARTVAAALVNNAAFNCVAGNVLVLSENWTQRAEFLGLLKRVLAWVPTRFAYYPGAEERYDRLTDGRRLIVMGDRCEGHLPWTVIPDVDPNSGDEPLFSTEPFCCLLAQTALMADEPTEFLELAARFCNERLWGTLDATIIVKPRRERDSAFARELDRAVAHLRYGIVSVNHWAGVGYGLASLPWGGYPHSTPWDIQSGTGWVHNTCLLDGIEKVVLRGPLVALPKPAWFADNRQAHVIGRKLTIFESSPSWLGLPSVILTALRG